MTILVADSKVETVRKQAEYVPGQDRFVLVGLAGPAAGVEYTLERPSTLIGRSTGCHICLTDDQVSRRHLQLRVVPDPLRSTRQFVMMQDLGSRNGVRVNGRRLTTTILDGGEKILVGRSVFRLDRRDDFDIAYGARQRALATRDALTGLGDRRALQDKLEQCETTRRSQAQAYTLLVIDIDHFKSVNDRFGHLAGDAALKHAAETILSAVRDQDAAFRMGGEEFVVVLPDCTAAEGAVVAERIRERLARTPAVHDGVTIDLTASVGVAGGGPLALSAADSALYEAKRSGRNIVREARPIAG